MILLNLKKWILLHLCVSMVFGVLAGPGKPLKRKVSPEVVPIKWSSFKKGNPRDENSLRMLEILLNTNKYALTTWWKDKGFASQTGPYLQLNGTREPQVRPPASEALTLAISLKTGAYDPVLTGVPLKTARDRAVKLTASLAYAHMANTAGGWGNHWQSAFWTYLAGTAGYLLWDELGAADREYVRKMVEHEANRFNQYPVPYYRDKAGKILSPGDTKAEENAWNSSLLQLATAMMPKHPNWQLWMNKNIELMISSYARPSDLNSSVVLHGKPVSEWLQGSNAEQNGLVINHSRVHPDYMSSITQLFNAPLLYTLAGMPTPRAAFFNADVVYDALVDWEFAHPPFQAPGGTIFMAGGAQIYYPQGNDWGTHRRLHFAYIDAAADAFGFDSLASRKGSYWEPYHAQMVLDMQKRPGHEDGRTYAARSEDTYAGREEWVAQFAGRAYLTRWIMQQNKYVPTNRDYTAPVRSKK